MSIPLVQNNEKDSINTSIIAIKRNIERINMLLGLSNSEEIDTSKFATKEELQQAVTDLQPVDEVTVDNMQSVSSNAVAQALAVDTGTLTATDETIDYIKYGKVVQLSGAYNGSIAQASHRQMSVTLPSALRPRVTFRALLLNNTNDNPIGQAVIQANGAIIMWVGSQAPSSNSPCVFSAIFIVD